MKPKSFLMTAVLSLVFSAIVGLVGCGPADSAPASQAIEALPFSVPEQFTYDQSATEKNGLLTFRSDNRTTLIVSYKDTSDGFLDQSREQEVTVGSLVESYRAAGLEVTVTDLERQDFDTGLLYTYTVHLANEVGATITRKYIKITDGHILDLSCGGNVTNEDAIDTDYAVVQAALE